MAIDFFIYICIFLSFLINLLALGAFWVTPGLRTTANRFTINLLLVNLIGCLVLASSNSDGFKTETATRKTFSPLERNASIELFIKPNGIILKTNVTSNEPNNSPRTIETIYIDESNESIVITEIEKKKENTATLVNFESDTSISTTINIRPIDMAGALGALAVLLVVGDTWCAVTDPLRYHSRMSGVKAWILIGSTWLLGILFGLRPANIVFTCIYFIIIILMPFGFVCGMYWRIFSEARQNGLRMRQNGSLPLLQGSLNLLHQQQSSSSSSSAQYQNNLNLQRNSICSTSSHYDGLQMKIDRLKNDSNTNLASTICNKIALGDMEQEKLTPTPSICLRQNNDKLISTLSGEIKRNFSIREFPLLCTSSQDPHESRQIPISAPNLQKYEDEQRNSASGLGLCSNSLLMRHPQQQLRHVQSRLHKSHNLYAAQTPKALSYMSSIRHRLSNASSLFKYRDESRAARISVLVVFMFLFSYLPYGFLMLLQSCVPTANFPHSQQLAIFMILVSNVSSPFIFAYRNKRVRRGVKRLFGIEKSIRDRVQKNQSAYNGRENGLLRRQNSELPIRIALKRSQTKSCSTIINFTLATNLKKKYNNLGCTKVNIDNIAGGKNPKEFSREVAIIKDAPIVNKATSKYKILKKLIRSSCAASQSCAEDERTVKPAEL